MAEVPLSTLHIRPTHMRAKGQVGSVVGRIHLFLTGSGLHIAGVPRGAAMLVVLTAHGLGGQSGIMLLLPSSPGLSSPLQGQAGGHSHGATGSRPSPYSGLGSRSAPLGSWCAGHNPCLWVGTRKPGGQASSPVQPPSCSPSDTAPQPSMYNPEGSSAGGPSSRHPGGEEGAERVV